MAGDENAPPPVPARSELRLSFSPETGAVNASEVHAFLERARSEQPGVNFSDCALRMLGELEHVTHERCTALGAACHYSLVYPSAFRAVSDEVAHYGRLMHENEFAQPPFIPGGVIRGKSQADIDRESGFEISKLQMPGCVTSPLLNHTDGFQHSVYMDRRFVEKLAAAPVPQGCRNKLLMLYRDTAELSGRVEAQNLVTTLREAGWRNPTLEERDREAARQEAADARCHAHATLTDEDLHGPPNDVARCTEPREGEQIPAAPAALEDTPHATLVRLPDRPLDREWPYGLGAPHRRGIPRPVYQFNVNFNFTLTGGSGSPDEYRRRANECYRQAAPALRGPEGEYVEIKLWEPGSGVNEPPAQTVTVHREASFSRSNSEEWRGNIDCATIVHETLHVLGLVDEYPEKWTGKHVTGEGAIVDSGPDDAVTLPDYNCRPIGPMSSIMSYQGLAYASVGLPVPEKDRDLVRQHRNEIQPRNSLLLPAQFRFITLPGCVSRNATYVDCVKSSYETARPGGAATCSHERSQRCYGPHWLELPEY